LRALRFAKPLAPLTLLVSIACGQSIRREPSGGAEAGASGDTEAGAAGTASAGSGGAAGTAGGRGGTSTNCSCSGDALAPTVPFECFCTGDLGWTGGNAGRCIETLEAALTDGSDETCGELWVGLFHDCGDLLGFGTRAGVAGSTDYYDAETHTLVGIHAYTDVTAPPCDSYEIGGGRFLRSTALPESCRTCMLCGRFGDVPACDFDADGLPVVPR
jgi:hypothetical protein